MHFKLAPINGDPHPPAGVNQDALNGLFGNLMWVVAVIAMFALVFCGIIAFNNHRHGQPNEGMSKAGMVFGVLFGIGTIGGIVGAITGT